MLDLDEEIKLLDEQIKRYNGKIRLLKAKHDFDAVHLDQLIDYQQNLINQKYKLEQEKKGEVTSDAS